MSDDKPLSDDFFLPDLCQAQSILFLVLVAELLVLVIVLAQGSLMQFDWGQLGLTSLFVQWVVLSSAAVLCNFRPILMKLSVAAATATGYCLILSLTLVFSLIAEWVTRDPATSWGMVQAGDVLRNLIVAAVMTGIAFRYFFLQHQLRRQEQAELKSRIQALQSRIRPHFLFNSMNIIASLIAVDPETAEEVVEDLSVLFRASLNQSSDKPVPLSDELDLCRKYVHIEGLRLDERLRVDWDVQVDPDSIRIPLLTLQPLLENSIYHGIQPLPGGGTVTVSIYEQEGHLVTCITNPRPDKNYSHAHGNRMALDNIARRLEAIYGREAKVETESLETTFRTTISYPLKSAIAAGLSD
ncbi:MAG: sensor histidine kinase [Pseudomonadales bacterium]|nr:sensor histidine kinase [Pseudomonadales bacterium]